MDNGYTFWLGASLVTFLAQLLLGTDPLFATISLAIFVLSPLVYRTYTRIGNLGGYVFLATYAKLFLVSQWLKIGFLQAADTHLLAPVETAVALLLGLLAFWGAGLALVPILAGRSGVLTIPQDPDFLRRVAVGAAAMTLLSILARHVLGLNRVGSAEYQEGQGLVILFYLGQMLPLATAALTARAAMLSNGRRFVDIYVILTILAVILQGFWENVRTIMLSGAVAFVATYLAYGGRVRMRHVVGALAATVVMQILVFPLIDLQRGFSRDTSIGEFISETFSVAQDLADPIKRDTYDRKLEDVYLSWSTRLYYGEPQGFLDRFAPNSLGETVDYIADREPFGIQDLSEQFLYGIPNVLLRIVGLERPIRGGQTLETAILNNFTNMNYGVLAEVYAHTGAVLFLPVALIVIVMYAGSLHALYGPIKRNYFAAFGFSTFYFSFSGSDLAEIIPSITQQGVIYLAFMMAMVALRPRKRRSPMPLPAHEATAGGTS